jgi:FixJ family two-component response regulator
MSMQAMKRGAIEFLDAVRLGLSRDRLKALPEGSQSSVIFAPDNLSPRERKFIIHVARVALAKRLPA